MKPAFILFFLLSLSFSSFSQLLVKARAGLNISRLQREEASFRGTEDNQVAKFGPTAGVAVEYLLKKGFSLQAELNYSLKGMKDEGEVVRLNGTYYGYGYNFHYAELPLLLRYAVTEKFRVGFGPSLSYLVKVHEILEGTDNTDPSRTYHKLDIGLNADLSYLFLKRFEVGARYNLGIKMVKYNKEDVEFPGIERVDRLVGRNRTMQVYLAYNFKR